MEAHEITRAVLVSVAISLAAIQFIVIVVVIVIFLDAEVYILSAISIATGDTLVPRTVKVKGVEGTFDKQAQQNRHVQ